MRERAIRFGKSATLVGVITEPTTATTGLPAVVLLNSGILHHVGACRLHVGVARHLASLGFTVLRFDHSGIGDSEPRRDKLPFEQSAVLEAQEAMDHLTTARGVREFALMGLCSGADMAFRVATVDPRVVALVQLDAWAYRTIGYWVRHYAPRLLRLSAWTNFARRRLGVGTAASVPERDAAAVGPEYRRKIPPQETVARDLRSLVDRGVQMYCIFSGGQSDRYNYRAQYAASFSSVPFGTQLRVDYLPGADHIFTGIDHQRHVIDNVGEWVSRLRAPDEQRRTA